MIGAIALHAAMDMLGCIGWPAITGYECRIALSLRRGLAAIPGVRLLGPDLDAETLPVATFTVEGVPHALVAARLAAEYGAGPRAGVRRGRASAAGRVDLVRRCRRFLGVPSAFGRA